MAFNFDQSKFMFRAKAGVQQAMASPDLVLVQVVAAIDDMDKVANLVSERLTEWYGYHYPEFKQADPAKFAKVVLALDKDNPDPAALAPIIGEQSAQLTCDRAKKSVGVYLSPPDLQAVREQAQTLLTLLNHREELVRYSDELATRLAPNLSHIAGASLAAKLIAQAGSLNKLASFPASTVQVIGAEKALFKHLRSGSPPPKHGLIFQHPAISTAPRWTRGKLSRALAAKLTIASKADAYTHHFIAEKLKEQFEARVKALQGKPEPARKPGAPSSAAPKRFDDRPRGGFGGRPSSGDDRPRGNFGSRPPFRGNRPQGGDSRNFQSRPPRSGGQGRFGGEGGSNSGGQGGSGPRGGQGGGFTRQGGEGGSNSGGQGGRPGGFTRGPPRSGGEGSSGGERPRAFNPRFSKKKY